MTSIGLSLYIYRPGKTYPFTSRITWGLFTKNLILLGLYRPDRSDRPARLVRPVGLSRCQIWLSTPLELPLTALHLLFVHFCFFSVVELLFHRIPTNYNLQALISFCSDANKNLSKSYVFFQPCTSNFVTSKKPLYTYLVLFFISTRCLSNNFRNNISVPNKWRTGEELMEWGWHQIGLYVWITNASVNTNPSVFTWGRE